jgi:hypothetical protein
LNLNTNPIPEIDLSYKKLKKMWCDRLKKLTHSLKRRLPHEMKPHLNLVRWTSGTFSGVGSGTCTFLKKKHLFPGDKGAKSGSDPNW